MNIKISVPTWATLPEFPNGIPFGRALTAINTYEGIRVPSRGAISHGHANPIIDIVSNLCLEGSSWVRGAGYADLATCDKITNWQYIQLKDIELIVGIDGEVEGYPVHFEIQNPTSLTPVSLPESESQGAQVSWENWGAPHHSLSFINNKWYRMSNVGESGRWMTATEWLEHKNATLGLEGYQLHLGVLPVSI